MFLFSSPLQPLTDGAQHLPVLAGLAKAENIDLTDLRGIAGGSGRKAVDMCTPEHL